MSTTFLDSSHVNEQEVIETLKEESSTFNSLWKYVRKSTDNEYKDIEYNINDINGISFNHSGYYSRYSQDEYEKEIFMLKDDHFTPFNLKKYIKMYIGQIFDDAYQDDEDNYFFRIHFKTKYGVSGYYVHDNKIIFSLINDDFYEIMLKEYNIYMKNQYEQIEYNQ